MRLVYLSPVPWESFSQRPHKFVEWFHATGGGDVLWIDPYPTRFPSWTDRKRITTSQGAFRKTPVPEWLRVIAPKCLPCEPLPGSGCLNSFFWRNIFESVRCFVQDKPVVFGVGKPSVLALRLLSNMSFKTSVYDAMDDFPAFYQGISRFAMARREQRCVRMVQRVLVSSSTLYERWKKVKPEICLIHNACEAESLPSIAERRSNFDKPVLGYVGTIGKWFDWELLFQLARAVPDFTIRLIGSLYQPPPEALPANVEILPPCDHAMAIKAMEKFSIGLIPFKSNELTASVDPIKYYEYRALGLPVLSSRFGEMALRERERGVWMMGFLGDDLALLVRNALEFHLSAQEIQRFRTDNSWAARFALTKLLPS